VSKGYTSGGYEKSTGAGTMGKASRGESLKKGEQAQKRGARFTREGDKKKNESDL